jgi:F-type H+-transporting ATPase subunit b
VNSAKESIQYEKLAAMAELKDQLATLSLEVAKKILKRELAEPGKQEEFVKVLMKDITFN